MHWIRAALVLLVVLGSVSAGVITREVSYPAGDVTGKGFLAAPDDGQKHPGVLVVHEFWGLNDYARERAKMLAELGYVALAVDMYGGGFVGAKPPDAMSHAQEMNTDQPKAKARFEGAMKCLQAQPEVSSPNIAAIGYCFGGGIVLRMAAENLPGLIGVASFHGMLPDKVPAGVKPGARILVCHGADDAYVTPEAVAKFKKAFADAGAEVAFFSYPGAIHGFTNPAADTVAKEFGLKVAYDPAADTQSWDELQEFLKAVFSGSD